MDHAESNALNASGSPAATQSEPSDVGLLSLLTIAGEQKKTLLVAFALLMAGVLAIAFLLPRQYVASTVVLLPQQQPSSAMAALGQLGALAGVAGAMSAAKSPDELYVALLKTRRLQDRVVQRLNLLDRLETRSMEFARAALSERVTILPDKKTGMITIEVKDKDREFAAALANAHVKELQDMVATLALTDAQQRRAFFERQITKTRQLFSAASERFRIAQAKSGFVVGQALAENSIRESLQMRALIATKEVQLQSVSRYATRESQEYQQVLVELAALRRKVEGLEAGGGEAAQSKGGQEALDAYRDMKVQEAVLEALVKQLEIAKLDEAREGASIQQIDPAVPPEGSARPKRSTVIVAGAFFALCLSTAIALLRGFVLRQPRAGNGSWHRMVAAWGFRQAHR